MERLLVVQDAFVARAGGVHVLPKITLSSSERTFSVTLRTPDARERAATATLDVMHVKGPLPPFGMLRIHDLTPAEVPIGTEILR